MPVLAFGQAFRPPTSVIVNIPLAGNDDRTQAPELQVSACSVQAHHNNVGAIYNGGADVTNAGGVNRGIKIDADEGHGPILMGNRNNIFLAADVAGDKAIVYCN